MSEKLGSLPPITARRLENGYILTVAPVAGGPERMLVATTAEQIGLIAAEWAKETERRCPLWQPGQQPLPAAAPATKPPAPPPTPPKPAGTDRVEGDLIRYGGEGSAG